MTYLQEALQDELVRLGCEHPYHTLYHLYALKNGNRGRDGQPSATGAHAGGMLQLIDHSKIAAASAVLQTIHAKSSRCTCSTAHASSHNSNLSISIFVLMAVVPNLQYPTLPY